MSAPAPITGDVSALLSFADAKALREYVRLSATISRSTHGPLMENAKFGAVMRDGKEVRMSKAYPAAPWPRVKNGEIMWSGREITARPHKSAGDSSGVGGYDMEHQERLKFAFVSRQFRRLAGVRIGDMQHSALDVFASFLERCADSDDLSRETCNCDSVAHLTAPFAALALEVRTEAGNVDSSACHTHNLKGKEAAFVVAVDITGATGRSHAAKTAGYDPAKVNEIADKLSAKPGIAAAIKLRERAAVIAARNNDWQLLVELRRRQSVGDLKPSQVSQIKAADAHARELMREACRAWNRVRVGQ
jgi:hypothetical protein